MWFFILPLETKTKHQGPIWQFHTLIRTSSWFGAVYYYGPWQQSIRLISLIKDLIWLLPICSMYGIFNNIGPKNHPNVGTYTIHGAYGLGESFGIHFFWLYFNSISPVGCWWILRQGKLGETSQPNTTYQWYKTILQVFIFLGGESVFSGKGLLVGGFNPSEKIWVRQLGWWYSQLNGKS